MEVVSLKMIINTFSVTKSSEVCFFPCSRHINTVDLQMEVTKFLHRCETSGSSQMAASSLPTLFGNNNMKMDVACKVCATISNIALFFYLWCQCDTHV